METAGFIKKKMLPLHLNYNTTEMLFVRDKGRMCNNILQYGHVYAWGREHGRKTMSMRFAYKYPYFHICDTAWHNFLTYVFAKYGAKTGLLPVISFNEDDVDIAAGESQMIAKRYAVVEGWYARWYDLFLKYKDEILSLFAFHQDIENHAQQVIASTEGMVRLGMHIRRGDYQRWYGGRFFYSDEQYVSVIRQFCSLFPGQQIAVYICGNDSQLNRDYYQQQLPACQLFFPDGNPGEDLCVLSHCDYLIGAPSTFSLVASMYHDAPLYWIEDITKRFTLQDFGHFDNLFRHIY